MARLLVGYQSQIKKQTNRKTTIKKRKPTRKPQLKKAKQPDNFPLQRSAYIFYQQLKAQQHGIQEAKQHGIQEIQDGASFTDNL